MFVETKFPRACPILWELVPDTKEDVCAGILKLRHYFWPPTVSLVGVFPPEKIRRATRNKLAIAT
jgi:hypothetical protein